MSFRTDSRQRIRTGRVRVELRDELELGVDVGADQGLDDLGVELRAGAARSSAIASSDAIALRCGRSSVIAWNASQAAMILERSGMSDPARPSG